MFGLHRTHAVPEKQSPNVRTMIQHTRRLGGHWDIGCRTSKLVSHPLIWSKGDWQIGINYIHYEQEAWVSKKCVRTTTDIRIAIAFTWSVQFQLDWLHMIHRSNNIVELGCQPRSTLFPKMQSSKHDLST